jgi:hypothetical protein
MPADRLDLISREIHSVFLDLAKTKGERKYGYSHVLDLRKTLWELPVMLHCGGYRSGVHKLQFIDVAHLGYRRIKEVTRQICGDSHQPTICRVDWCVDIPGIDLLDLALYCRLGRVQNCAVIRSRSGITFYLRFSKARTVLFYDKLRQLASKPGSILNKYSMKGPLTRVEVQFRRDLPYRRLKHLQRYTTLDLLPNLSFWQAGRKSDGLKTKDTLAAEGLLHRIDENGLQLTSKGFSAQEWAYLMKTLLKPAPEAKFPDLNKLLRKSACDWLEDKIRFPRLTKRGRT